MTENRIKILIKKPIEIVFEFTINPKNTSEWISHIAEEITSEYPIKVGTIYKNHAIGSDIRDSYTVIEYEESKIFHLYDENSGYHVCYIYNSISDNQTELEYFEWMNNWDLQSPFDHIHLEKLKEILERDN